MPGDKVKSRNVTHDNLTLDAVDIGHHLPAMDGMGAENVSNLPPNCIPLGSENLNSQNIDNQPDHLLSSIMPYDVTGLESKLSVFFI